MDLETVVIKHGAHRSPEQGACAMELASMLAHEPFSDHPSCVCTVVGSMVRTLNDRIPDDEARTALLKPILPKLLDTAGSAALRRRRAFMAADAAIHIFAPSALEHAKKPELAAKLRAAPEVVDAKSARAAREVTLEVRPAGSSYAAYAAADAADAAAYAAADAAAYAADAAAYAAADAAAYAAYAAAARRAEYEKCVALIERLCELKDEAA